MEPEKRPFKQDSSLQRTQFHVPCLFGGVYRVSERCTHPSPVLEGAGDLVSSYKYEFK